MLNALQAQALLITYISKSKESTYCKRSHHRPQLWLRAIAQCYDVRILKHLDHHHQSIMVLSLIRNQPSFGQIKSDRNLMIWNGGSILVALIPLISFFVARHGVANAANNGNNNNNKNKENDGGWFSSWFGNGDENGGNNKNNNQDVVRDGAWWCKFSGQIALLCNAVFFFIVVQHHVLCGIFPAEEMDCHASMHTCISVSHPTLLHAINLLLCLSMNRAWKLGSGRRWPRRTTGRNHMCLHVDFAFVWMLNTIWKSGLDTS